MIIKKNIITIIHLFKTRDTQAVLNKWIQIILFDDISKFWMTPHRVIAEHVFLEGIIRSGIFYDVALTAGRRRGEERRRVFLNQSAWCNLPAADSENLSQFHKKTLRSAYSGVTYKFVVARTCAERGNIYRVGRMRESATSGAPDLKA